jgi:hypothetical protein
MLKHLRAQNRAIERGLKDVNSYLKKISPELALDESGRVRLQFQEVGLHIRVMPEYNLILFKTFINFLPDPVNGNLLPLYYHLLDHNDSPDTGLAYFCIVDAQEIGADKDVISVEFKRPITDTSEDEFKSALGAVGEVANIYMKRLEEEFGAPLIP